MSRPAPKDHDYPGSFAKTFTTLTADQDLTAQFTEAPFPPCEIWIFIPAGTVASNFIFGMASDPVTDVTIALPAVAAGTGMVLGPFRMQVARIDETTTDAVTIFCIWQAGPA